jgi:hypothetical protein
MHLYLNYAREHWTRDGENPPVGLILCAKRDAAFAKYALEGLSNKVLAAESRTTLPDEKGARHGAHARSPPPREPGRQEVVPAFIDSPVAQERTRKS